MPRGAITVRLDDELREAVGRMLDDEGVTLTDLISEFLAERAKASGHLPRTWKRPRRWRQGRAKAETEG